MDYLLRIKQIVSRRYRLFLKYYCTKQYANVLYKDIFGKGINWRNPVSINEKINCLEFSRKSMNWHLYADKFKVRDYVASRGCGDILVPLLGVWDSVDDMNFDGIDVPFVVKLNNGYGDVSFVRDKNAASIDELKEKYRKQLRGRFGLDTAEPHYLRIQPKLIAEKMLQPADGSSLVDYKFYCFNGKPYCIMTASNRDHNTHQADFNIFDLEWNRRPEVMFSYFKNDVEVRKPHHLNEMIEYARKISQGQPQARIDFYEVNGEVYFGEMTMTSFAGKARLFTDDFLKELGSQFSV